MRRSKSISCQHLLVVVFQRKLKKNHQKPFLFWKHKMTRSKIRFRCKSNCLNVTALDHHEDCNAFNHFVMKASQQFLFLLVYIIERKNNKTCIS